MHVFQECAIGFFKPAADFVFAILIYAFAEFFNVIVLFQSSFPQSSMGSIAPITTIVVWIYLGIFAIVAIVEEMIWGMRLSYLNAVSKIIGVILGTWFFWDILIDSYLLIGSSENEMIFSAMIMIAAMCLGICLRFFISKNSGHTSKERFSRH